MVSMGSKSAGVLLAASVLLVALSGAVRAQTADASLDSTHYRIGDWIDLHVKVVLPPDLQAVGPQEGDVAGMFEILTVRKLEPERVGGSKQQVWTIRLTTFDTSATAIPAFRFDFVNDRGDSIATAETQPIPVLIKTVPIDESSELKEIKPPMTPPWTLEDAIPYLILLLLVAAIIGGYYWYFRRKKPVVSAEPQRPAVPPHQLALFALRALEDRRLWQQGKVKEYYSEVTEIIRRFFEGRLGIIALELTSDEILQQLKTVPAALPLWKEISAFFLTADLVKFAKYQPTMAEHEAELQMAYGIVRAMTPKSEPTVHGEVSSDAR